MAKKRDEKAAEKGDEGYEFKLPPFDEKAFVRREVESAKASFWTVGIGILAGIVSTVVWVFAPDWKYGWLPLIGALLVLRPALKAMGFRDELLTPKALFGSYFMLFFTGLSIWVLGVNFAP